MNDRKHSENYMNNSELIEKSQAVLLGNKYEVVLNGQSYRRTVPSKEFYVHQWNWDSATHAMGLVYFDEQRAFDELYSLVSGQWKNGLIAQITFNPNESKYFPGPEFWGTEKFAKGEIQTSGVTQPPLLGISFAHVYKNTKDEKLRSRLIEEVLPAVLKYHDYLKKYRDPENSGLLTVVHPWESGLDNSPRWDLPLANISLEEITDEVKIMVNENSSDDKIGDPKDRPGMDDYYKYMYLVNIYKSWNWDYEKIIKESPFAVKDVLFNALWARANEALSDVLVEISHPQAQRLKDWAGQTKDALNNCWDEKLEIYRDKNVSKGRNEFIEENTIATFTPLWAGVPDAEKLELTLDNLEDSEKYWTQAPVATTPVSSNKFSLTKYWRGPTWPITNLFVIEGLSRYKNIPRAKKLRDSLVESTLKMIKDNGFYEYYDPTSGTARPDKKDTALGFGSFSWTAAVTLYLLNKYKSNQT